MNYPCPTKTRLLSGYKLALSIYIKLVLQYVDLLGSRSRGEALASTKVQMQRCEIECRAAQALYSDHLLAHGCGFASKGPSHRKGIQRYAPA